MPPCISADRGERGSIAKTLITQGLDFKQGFVFLQKIGEAPKSLRGVLEDMADSECFSEEAGIGRARRLEDDERASI